MTNGRRVVVVGSGPSGLAAAIELATRGITCTILERQSRAGYAPRAKTTHTRTREHLRRWGIAEKLAKASPFGVDYPSHVVYVTRLGGELIHRFEKALQCAPDRDERYSEHGQWIPQYKLEGVLRDHALSLPGVELHFGREFIGVEENEDGVAVKVRDVDSGAESLLAADYLIGADGARSAVRDAIGATMVGTYGLSRNYNTIFRAPGLAEAHRHGPGIMYVQVNGDVPGLIGPMDEGDLWYFMPTDLTPGVTYTEEEAAAAIKLSTGIDLPYEILSSDEWVASRFLSDRYRRGRIFLTGDACHLHPPFGGFGMNMGIADSVDLGWKIAAVIDGWGGPALLDSYEIERRPAHEFVLDESAANLNSSPNALYRPGIEEVSATGESLRRELAQKIVAEKTAEFYALGVVLGYCYRDSPVIVDDGTCGNWARSLDYVPSASPGCLAPHLWLPGDRSLYDLFGSGFTLLALDASAENIAAARRDAERSGVPLAVVERSDPALRALYKVALTLIRPDQHIAWRGQHWPGNDLLAIVTGRCQRPRRTAGGQKSDG
ncbi:MAG: putative FAD-monooxygenase [Bradyrhizobium sp.]|nr:putative FAD-monooxygenase [Bradyrhizobium sp.]